MSNRMILHVEDDPDLARYFRVAFKTLKCEYTQLSNGVEALKWLEGNTPALILSDMMMPRMGGFEMAKEIRDKFPHLNHVPIIFITAFDTDELKDAAKLVAGHTTKVYPKPIHIETIQSIAATIG